MSYGTLRVQNLQKSINDNNKNFILPHKMHPNECTIVHTFLLHKSHESMGSDIVIAAKQNKL